MGASFSHHITRTMQLMEGYNMKRRTISVALLSLMLTACGGGGSGSGGGQVDLAKHKVIGKWIDSFDNNLIYFHTNGSYTLLESGIGKTTGTWTASSQTRFRMPTSRIYNKEGVVVSNNRVEFPEIKVGTPSGRYTLNWKRLE